MEFEILFTNGLVAIDSVCLVFGDFAPQINFVIGLSCRYDVMLFVGVARQMESCSPSGGTCDSSGDKGVLEH